MKVYHGSYVEIREINLEKCLPQKDFGQGFYVTKFRNHAENWAKVIGKKHNTEGVATEFEYNESAFAKSICKIKHFDEYNEEWLDFVVANRQNENAEPIHDFDIVEGAVADDKIQNRIYAYLNGEVSKQDFLMELIYHEATHQICFCTQLSLQLLKSTHTTNVSKLAKIGENLVEQLMLDCQIDEEKAIDLFYNSNTFAQLSDETTELYKKSWQEIYEILKKEIGKYKKHKGVSTFIKE